MGPFDKPSDPQSPTRLRQTGENVPLVPLRRGLRSGSHNQNIWNDETDEGEFAHEMRTLLAKKSSDSFHEFLAEEGEDTDRLLHVTGRDEGAVDVEQTEELEDEAKLSRHDSPYEEVRAAVSNTDDPSMACVPVSLFPTDCIGDVSSLGDGQYIRHYWFWSQYSIFHASPLNLSIDTYRSTSGLPHRQYVGQIHA